MLLSVKMPKIRLKDLISKVKKIKVSDNLSCYFLYSEFLMRASRNQDYSEVLNEADILAIDGKGVQWMANYNKKPTLGISKIFNFVKNGILMFSDFVLKKKYQIENDLILGRDFVYNIFEIASLNNQKIAIICASIDNLLKENLQKKYPNLNFCICSFDPNSQFMSEKKYAKLLITKKHLVMNKQDILPEFEIAKDFVAKESPEIVMVCLGGSSGKQEFLINYLKKSNAKFGIAMGFGAALDHLGAGQKQTKIPAWVEKFGIEAFYRLYKNPKRLARIWDSLINFLWKCS
jgi:exopolysaccharide biosynthesis WecB/TagA/CpsF family protein